MSNALQIISPDDSSLTAEAHELLDEANEIIIVDATTYRQAAEFRASLKRSSAEVVNFFAGMKQKAHAAWKEIVKKESDQLSPRTAAEQIINRKLADYDNEQERVRRAKEIELQKEARRLEEARILAEAVAAEEDGDSEAAEEIISAPIVAAPVRVETATPKVAGLTYRVNWTFKVSDKLALVRYVAQHPEFLNLLTENTTAIGQIVRAQKDACNLPGVRAFADRTPVSSARR